jgi:G3E family GTPase
MKLLQVAGWLGSGKTTLIIALSRALAAKGSRVAILVNEIGAIPVDGKVIQDYGLTVKDIGGGCICCQVAGSLMRTLRLLSEGPRPEMVIIEPTGIAVPNSIKQAILSGAQKQELSMGPTIVLFDTTREEKLLTYESLKRLVTTQLKDADIIALSKVDMVSHEVIARVGDVMHSINPVARIVHLSTVRGDGIETLIQATQETTASA